MKNSFGNSVSVTIFGESHGKAVGAVIDGLAPGITVDEDYIAEKLSLRRPSGKLSTARAEKDEFVIESGVFNGKTTGTPVCIIIPNSDTKNGDYEASRGKARPGHADYSAFCKYHGFEDYRGGGHFSGRITAALVAAGSIAQRALEEKGILIGTHISECAGVSDKAFSYYESEIKALGEKYFAVLDESCGEKMKEKISAAAEEGDSAGGILETAVVGLPAGIGEPWFDSVEGILSHILFSVPAVKGVEFGEGFALAGKKGSEANDPFRIKDGAVYTEKNSNGGINGGITNGMPVVFRCAVKPTPSIYKEQETVDFISSENCEIQIKGRHDPCIVPRARAVIDSVTALALCDLLSLRFGTDWLGAQK